MIIITAPSGAGKTTIVRHVLSHFDKLSFSVSATTRPMRPYEIDGKDYYFLSSVEFMQKKDEGKFLEWEQVYRGSYYGTLRKEVERLWDAGFHVIFDVDVMGALALKRAYPARSLSVFICPPDLKALELRLRNRKTENEQSLKLRIDRARHEMEYADSFDYQLVNDNLDKALKEATELISNFLHKGAVEKPA